jgi:hypothetical protein
VRASGLGVVDHVFDEGISKESRRMRNCANRAKQPGTDAIFVIDDEKVIKVFNLTKKEVREFASLFDHAHSVALAIKFQARQEV